MIYYYKIYILDGTNFIVINKNIKMFDWDSSIATGVIRIKDISKFEDTQSVGSKFMPLEKFLEL